MHHGIAHQYAAYSVPCGRKDRIGLATKKNGSATIVPNAIEVMDALAIRGRMSLPFAAMSAVYGKMVNDSVQKK